MRDFKLRMKIIWSLLKNDYTKSEKYNCWWLWNNKDYIRISFGKENFNKE